MSDWKNAGDSNVWDYKTEGKGAELQGIFSEREEHIGENDSNLYSFTVNGERVQVWGSSVLDVRLKNVEVGEEVKITYLGQEKSEKRKGKTYHNFTVLHRKPEGAVKVEKTLDDLSFDDLDSVK